MPAPQTHKKRIAPAHSATGKGAGKASVANAHKGGGKGKGKLASRRPRGQKSIEPERAREIQLALIREHYLDGEPTGMWDARSKAAMARYQHDNGWQEKITPDARALIKLGLGPRHDGLLNPDRAAFAAPPPATPEKTLPPEAMH